MKHNLVTLDTIMKRAVFLNVFGFKFKFLQNTEKLIEMIYWIIRHPHQQIPGNTETDLFDQREIVFY